MRKVDVEQHVLDIEALVRSNHFGSVKSDWARLRIVARQCLERLFDEGFSAGKTDAWRTDMGNAPKDQRILIGYWYNPSDGGKPTFVWQPAFYIEAYTYPIGEYGNVHDGDYDEDRDEIFVKAGWYSDPTTDEGGVRIGFEPTFYCLIGIPSEVK